MSFVIIGPSLKVLVTKNFITKSPIWFKKKKKEKKTFSDENVSSLKVFLTKNIIQWQKYLVTKNTLVY